MLDQHEYWIDALRIPHLISDRWDMTDSYLLGLIEFPSLTPTTCSTATTAISRSKIENLGSGSNQPS